MAETTIDALMLKFESDMKNADASIDRLANAFVRLKNSLNGADFTNISTLSAGLRNLSSSMERMMGVKTADFTRISNGLNKLTGTNVQGVSDTARAINVLVQNLNSMGHISFDSEGIQRISNSISKLGWKTVTQAADNIPKLNESLTALTKGMAGLDFKEIDLSSLNSLTNSISKLGGAAAGRAASGNIDNLAKALKNMMATLSTAPKVSSNVIQMTQALAQLASAGGRAGTATRSLSNSFNLLPASTTKARKSTLSLAAAFGKFYATYWLLLRALGMFKKAIDISSDLTEVQNVVDVTFGEMADKVDELASHSIEDFGMSELTVKDISSRFQAMGVAMGFAQDEMSDMSIELTKLAADMASFYNVEQKVVAEDLESIFTGQTRPLRQYGLDLTQATLAEWAMKNGLDANIKTMSQAEKTLLRYQYVMANTGAAQGDFARTQGTWANQTRILAQSFQALGAVVGGVLINAFKPFIAALNSVMGAIIQFARTVSDALGAIFGWKFETGGGVAQDLEFGAGAAEDIEDATGGAADNAKKMKTYLAGWQEVNNMTSDSGGGGGGGGGGGAGGGGVSDGSIGEWVKSESLWEEYTSSIDTLYELGEYISGVLTDAMNDIDWDSVYESARGFGSGLANFLNGLISPELFGATGTTIAGALNMVLHGLDSFGTTFNWTNFGNSIATGTNNFFSDFDFALLASTLNTWAGGLLDAAIEALSKTNWYQIGSKIGEFIEDINFIEILKKVGVAIWEGINAAFETYEGMFETAPLETALLTLATLPKLLKTTHVSKFVNSLSKGIVVATNFTGALLGNKTSLATLQSMFPKTSKAVDTLATSIWSLRIGFTNGNWLAGVDNAFSNIRNNLSGTQKVAITAAAAFGEFMVVKDSIKDIATDSGNLLVNLAELAGAAGVASAAMYASFGPAGLAFAAIVGIAGAIKGIDEAMDEVAENSAIGQFSEKLSTMSGEIEQTTSDINDKLSSMKGNVEEAGAAEAAMARDLATEYQKLASQTNLTATEQSKMKEISGQLVQLVPGLNKYIDEQTGLLDVQNSTLDALIENMELYAKRQAAQEGLTEAYKLQYEATKNVEDAQEDYNDAANEFINSHSGLSNTVKGFVTAGDVQGLKEYVKTISQSGNDFSKLEGEFGKGIDTIGEVNKVIDLLDTSTSEYRTALNDANQTQSDAKENLDFYKGAMSDVNAEIEKNNADLDAAEKTTSEYKQTVSDLNTEFSNLGLTISTELAEKLALNDSGATASIVQMFGTMKSQVQLSSAELQTLFSNLGLNMSSGFTTSLANEEANIQAQISMTFANLAAGAEVSSSELTKAFSLIGINLPEEITKGFASKEPYVQTKTINLLSKLQEGYSLVSGNLLEVFSSFGISVPTSMISSMESMDAATQQSAIELLSEIKTGYDGTAPDLLREFNQLGLDIPDELQGALESEKSSTQTEAINLLKELLSAEESERPTILKRMKDLGTDASNDLNEGYKSNTEEIRNTAKENVKAVKEPVEDEFSDSGANSTMYGYGANASKGFWQGVKDWWDDSWLGRKINEFKQAVAGPSGLDENSPSKVMKLFGAYAIEGFNIGMEDEFPETFSMVDDWTSGIVNYASSMKMRMPQLDLSVPQMDISPKGYNLDKLKGNLQLEMDAKMAQYSYEVRQLREQMSGIMGILSEMNEKGLVFDDTMMERKFKSASNKYFNRTGEQLGLA